MPPPSSRTRSFVPPELAVTCAKNLARNYRTACDFLPEGYLPLPTEADLKAYAVLLELELIDHDSYEWSAQGRDLLALGEPALSAVFDRYLDKLQLSKEGKASCVPTLRSAPIRTTPLATETNVESQSPDSFETTRTGPVTLREFSGLDE